MRCAYIEKWLFKIQYQLWRWRFVPILWFLINLILWNVMVSRFLWNYYYAFWAKNVHKPQKFGWEFFFTQFYDPGQQRNPVQELKLISCIMFTAYSHWFVSRNYHFFTRKRHFLSKKHPFDEIVVKRARRSNSKLKLISCISRIVIRRVDRCRRWCSSRSKNTQLQNVLWKHVEVIKWTNVRNTRRGRVLPIIRTFLSNLAHFLRSNRI